MRLLGLILWLLCISCYTEKHNLVNKSDYDKVISAKNASFFNGFDYEPATNKRDNILLLYKNDSLKYLSFGNSKLTKYASIYRIDILADSLTQMVRTSSGRYQTFDTIQITNNEYYTKRSLRINGVSGNIIAVEYDRYVFTKKYLIRSDQSFFPYPDSSFINESLSDHKEHIRSANSNSCMQK